MSVDHFTGTVTQLHRKIIDSGKLNVTCFTATWCGPCRRLHQVLPDLAAKYEQVNIIACDVDQNNESASFYQVQGIPCIKYLRADSQGNVTVVDEVVGFQPNVIAKKIEQLL